MNNTTNHKSSASEIRERFDKDVERFSNLETGQQTVIDARLSLELITEAASYVNPAAVNLLDIGCGAGNYSLKMLQKIPGLNCTLIDLSMPMLNRAEQRLSEQTTGSIVKIQADINEINLPANTFDIVLAGAVFHHLREDKDWENVFLQIFQSLKQGGSMWVCDLVTQDYPAVNQLFQDKYAVYLTSLGGEEFKNHVLDYIEKEDTPRSVTYQIRMLEKVGFKHIELLHKSSCFAAFGAIK
jgi:tRNA (cmo5U34)-methyltransferase